MTSTQDTHYNLSCAEGVDQYLRDHPDRVSPALPLSVFIHSEGALQSRVAFLLRHGSQIETTDLQALYLIDEALTLRAQHPSIRADVESILARSPQDTPLLISGLQTLISHIISFDPLGR